MSETVEHRLADARARVEELEKAKADALGQNVLDTTATREAIEALKAKESLARYEAGPAKIAKRWDEKIEPAKKTLERLERQWKSS
jgi:hypothetical protein